MAPLMLSLAAKGNRAWTLAFAVVMVGFYLDMRFVASSRTALVYFPILLILFALAALGCAFFAGFLFGKQSVTESREAAAVEAISNSVGLPLIDFL